MDVTTKDQHSHQIKMQITFLLRVEKVCQPAAVIVLGLQKKQNKQKISGNGTEAHRDL